MIKKTIWIGLVLSVLGFMSAAVRADDRDEKMVLTFSQPVEVSGHVLPAGTYTFRLAGVASDRHIVQIFNADQSQIIATVLAIPHYRTTTTGEAILTFNEVPAGSSETIRAWFYPGSMLGHEFVYPRVRATQLAKVARVAVPALAVEVADIETLKTAPIMAITPDEEVVPAVAAMQSRPMALAMVGTAGVTQSAQIVMQIRETRTQLPETASAMTLIVFLGLGSIGIAFCLIAFGRPALAPVGR